MQRITSIFRTFGSLAKPSQLPSLTKNCSDFLTPFNPVTIPACGFKVKGRVRRRCQHCYIVHRDERVYNICPKSPRHKQMSMKPKPLTTYILTHATQSKVRPW